MSNGCKAFKLKISGFWAFLDFIGHWTFTHIGYLNQRGSIIATMKKENNENETSAYRETGIYPEFINKVEFMRQMGINANNVN